jgi:predicted nucleic acid-binding protein
MAEVYYFLLRTYDQKTADYLIRKMNFKLVNIIKLDVVLEASKLKFEHKAEKLSYIDCLGYCIAKTLNMKFLTGDEKFEKKSNVEFAK